MRGQSHTQRVPRVAGTEADVTRAIKVKRLWTDLIRGAYEMMASMLV